MTRKRTDIGTPLLINASSDFLSHRRRGIYLQQCIYLRKSTLEEKQTQKQNNKDFQTAADPRAEGDTKSLSWGFLRVVTLSSEQWMTLTFPTKTEGRNWKSHRATVPFLKPHRRQPTTSHFRGPTLDIPRLLENWVPGSGDCVSHTFLPSSAGQPGLLVALPLLRQCTSHRGIQAEI